MFFEGSNSSCFVVIYSVGKIVFSLAFSSNGQKQGCPKWSTGQALDPVFLAG